MSVHSNVDVVVIGGGPAGVVAATQAGRLGASTLLVEKNGLLGGTTVAAGVNLPGLFHAHGKHIIRGIGWELVHRTVEECGQTLPDFTDLTQPHWKRQIPVDRAIYAALADQMIADAGVTVRFHTLLGAAEYDDATWLLILCGKEGLYRVNANVLIDCSGDANAVSLAGGEVERNDWPQPGTLMVRAAGYEMEGLDISELEQAYQTAVAAGVMKPSDLCHDVDPVLRFLLVRGENCIHLPGVEGRTSEERSHAEMEARKTMLRIYRFFRAQPGLENFHFDYFAQECGIRETVTIKAKVKITREDYCSGRLWEDAVCYSFYPIDIHREGGMGTEIIPLPEGVFPTIPRGAMLPQKLPRCIVAGRCVSGDKEANSAFRVQASSMAMGQAAGVMAALSSASNCDPEDVPLRDIYDCLRRHGAVVPGDCLE